MADHPSDSVIPSEIADHPSKVTIIDSMKFIKDYKIEFQKIVGLIHIWFKKSCDFILSINSL